MISFYSTEAVITQGTNNFFTQGCASEDQIATSLHERKKEEEKKNADTRVTALLRNIEQGLPIAKEAETKY